MENVVTIPCGEVDINFTEEQYESIASFVRKKDRIQYAKDVLGNVLTEGSGLEDYASLYDAICNNDPLIEQFALELDEAVNGNTGETEYYAVEDFIKKLHVHRYDVISNMDTDEEQTDEVILPEAIAEKIKNHELEGLNFIQSVAGDDLDPVYIDEIIDCGEVN